LYKIDYEHIIEDFIKKLKEWSCSSKDYAT
jgi:hypothetical protein